VKIRCSNMTVELLCVLMANAVSDSIAKSVTSQFFRTDFFMDCFTCPCYVDKL